MSVHPTQRPATDSHLFSAGLCESPDYMLKEYLNLGLTNEGRVYNNIHISLKFNGDVQFSIADTLGTAKSVVISEMSTFQG